MSAWRAALGSLTSGLGERANADVSVFAPLIEVASAAGESSDGALMVEWVAANEPGRFGVTVFDHTRAGPHLDVAREVCRALFDGAALDAWDETHAALRPLEVALHVGLAWDARSGYRLKLFVGRGAGLHTAARWLGLRPGDLLVGVGCDFWTGGRYRPRRYFRANDFATLVAFAGAGVSPPPRGVSLPPRGHVVLTLTEAGDALGDKTTWSVIFPPTSTLATLGDLGPPALCRALTPHAEQAAPYVLRPSAFEFDIYRDGRDETELLLTLGNTISPPRTPT